MRLALSFSWIVLLAFFAPACGGGDSAGAESDIVFVSTRDGDYALYGMRSDGSGEGRLTTDERAASDADARVFFQAQPAWSPDGQEIAFMSRREGRPHLYVMRADGTGTRRLTSGPHDDQAPAWSPDGRLIAFTRDDRLSVIPAGGGVVSRVIKAGADRYESDPTWSPDGAWLAYVDRTGGPDTGELWKVRLDGTSSRQLTRLNAGMYGPAWSPRGRLITFASNARDGRWQIYVSAADGRGLRRWTFRPGDYFDPSWSPDGRELVFAYDGVITSRTRDGVETALSDGMNDASPAWRPARPEP